MEPCALQPEGKLDEEADLPIARKDRFQQERNHLDQTTEVRSSTLERFVISSSLPLVFKKHLDVARNTSEAMNSPPTSEGNVIVDAKSSVPFSNIGIFAFS